MTRLRERVSTAQLRVLLALVAVYGFEGRATVRDVADFADRSVSTTFYHLENLRAAGLATWEHGRSGTLRPLVYPVRMAA